MPDISERVSNESLRSQIQGLGVQIEDVKTLLVSYEARIRCLERAGDKTTPITEKRIDILEKSSEAHAKELDDLREMITTEAQSIKDLTNGLETIQKIWKWALGIFTAVMIALIILFITGQATMVFK